MAWAKVDDQLAFHPKAVRAGNEAMGVWVRILSYCTAHETDGQIARSVLETITGPARFAATVQALVRVGLLDRIGRDRWTLHDYHDYQPTAEEAKEHRKYVSQMRSEFGRRGGYASAASKRSKTGSKTNSNLVPKQNKQNGSPVPSRPNTDSASLAKPSNPDGDNDSADRFFGPEVAAMLRQKP